MEPAGCIKASERTSDPASDPVLEIVVCEGPAAVKAHKDLFNMNDSCYRVAGGDILPEISSVIAEDPARLHIAAGWESLLRIALWSGRRPLLHDVLGLLKKAGVSEADLLPFRQADINDIFPWLYYGKRFETLRKIANRAKARAEAALGKKTLIVYCHLVYEDTGGIVASSL